MHDTIDQPVITPAVPDTASVKESLRQQSLGTAIHREKAYHDASASDLGYATSPTSSAAPGDSPYYNRAFWAAYKGASRGLMGGILLGGLIGLGIGGMVAGGLALAWPAAAATLPVAASIVAGCTLVGAKYYKDVFSTVGAVAGSNSAVMEIADQRSEIVNHKLDKILEIMERKMHVDPKEIDDVQKNVSLIKRRNEQYFEDKFSNTPAFFGQIGIVGAVIGALFAGAAVAAIAYAGGHGLFGLHESVAGVATVASGALAGASYGINRHYYRQFFNFTNALYEGDLRYFEKQRSQERANIIDICDGKDNPNCGPLVGQAVNGAAPQAQAAVVPVTADGSAVVESSEPADVRRAHAQRVMMAAEDAPSTQVATIQTHGAVHGTALREQHL